MRPVLAIAIALVVVTMIGCSARQLKKPARLILPAEVTLHGYDADLRPVVDLQWDEADTVSIEVELSSTQADGHSRAYVVGALRVYDAEGKNMEFQGMVTGPFPSPNGKSEIKKGGGLNMPFYSTIRHSFRNPGRYYAIAQFSGITTRGAKVTFTTEKQWFQLIGEK